MTMPSPSGLIIVSTGFEKEADAHACLEELLKRRLAACGHIYYGQSAYFWEEKLQKGDEWVLRLKTLDSQWDQLQTTIKEIHPYDVPMIIGEPVLYASADYVEWARKYIEEI